MAISKLFLSAFALLGVFLLPTFAKQNIDELCKNKAQKFIQTAIARISGVERNGTLDVADDVHMEFNDVEALLKSSKVQDPVQIFLKESVVSKYSYAGNKAKLSFGVQFAKRGNDETTSREYQSIIVSADVKVINLDVNMVNEEVDNTAVAFKDFNARVEFDGARQEDNAFRKWIRSWATDASGLQEAIREQLQEEFTGMLLDRSRQHPLSTGTRQAQTQLIPCIYACFLIKEAERENGGGRHNDRRNDRYRHGYY